MARKPSWQDSALPEKELRDAYAVAAAHTLSFARSFSVALDALLSDGRKPSAEQWNIFADALWPLYMPTMAAAFVDARESLQRRRLLKAKKPIPIKLKVSACNYIRI